MPKHILQLCRLTPLWGMDLYQAISQGLAEQGNCVTTVFIAGAPMDGLAARYQGDIIFLSANKKKWFWQRRVYQQLKKLFSSHTFDVVIAHQYQSTQFVDRLCAQFSVPHCISVHHTIGNFRHLKRRAWLRWCSQAKWLWIGVSKAVMEDLLQIKSKKIRPDNTCVIPNAIDIATVQQAQLTRAEARISLGIPEDAFVFGTLGRLVVEKNHTCLLHALIPLISDPSVYLVIIGKGPLEQRLRTQATTLGIEHRVYIDSDHAAIGARLLTAFDVFMLPSLYESFGIVLLEAMAARLPIIATQAGGVPDVVDVSVAQLNPKDHDIWTQAMRTMLQASNEARAALGLQGYQHLQKRFSLEHYQKQWCAIVS